VCAGEKIFAELACFFSCIGFFLVYYFIGQPILTLFMVRQSFSQLSLLSHIDTLSYLK
jgi:hypothetical protein